MTGVQTCALPILMTQINNETLLILRGHLLIEEQLQKIIDGAFQNPNALGNLNFYNKQKIVKAIKGNIDPDPLVWDSINKIRKLRNDLAHKIEINDLRGRIDDIIAPWNNSDYIAPFGLGSGRSARLRSVFSFICGILSSL